MKLTFLWLTIALSQLQAAALAQSMTLAGKDIPLRNVFAAIKEQTGYVVFYNQEMLTESKPVTLSVSHLPLNEFLGMVLKGQPLEYIIRNKTIILSEKKVLPGKDSISVFLPVSGKVTTKDGQPIPGATIRVRDSKIGTTTNERGDFSLATVADNAVLEITALGFAPLTLRLVNGWFVRVQSKAAKASNDEDRSRMQSAQPGALVVLLGKSTSPLDEVQVIAYGTTSRRFSTGSISTVTGKQIETQPVMNPMLALRGLVPGLVVTPTGGYASSPVKILVRGRNNINPLVSSEPLILIDGMPITNINLNGSDQTKGSSIVPVLNQIAANPTGGQSPLFGLNPLDIESITVLKDADATAIYGSRGANGVILITTKKGAAGPSKFNLSINEGISKVTRHYDMLNTAQYIAIRKEALKNDGLALTPQNAPDLTVWDTTRSVDWKKELWGGTGKVTNVNAGFSGGNATTNFRLNGGYSRQTSILTLEGGAQSGNVAISLGQHSLDRKFSLSLSSVYTYSQTDAVNQVGLASTLAPNTPPMYDADGGLNYAPWNAGGLQLAAEFPFGALLQRSTASTNSLNGNLTLNYEPVKGLELKTSLGYNNVANNSRALIPVASQNPEGYDPTGSAAFTTVGSGGWTVEPQLNYNTAFGKSKISILLGGTISSSYSRYSVLQGRGYQNDELLNSIMNAPIQDSYDASGQYKYAGGFARFNYNLKDRYLLNLSGRRDGSSRFGPGNQFGNFGSVGAAWIVSDEKWFRQLVPSLISFFKLKGSYGITGSDGVADYQYLSQWSSGTGNNLIPGYNGIERPLINQHAVNQFFHWQANKALNTGVEIGLFDDNNLSLDIEHYRNRCNNQLLNYPTPYFTGFPTVVANWPATVQNSGWEFSLQAGRLIKTKNFSWSASANISFNKNILQAYPGIENTPYYSQMIVGQSLDAMYLFHYLGIDPLTGQYSFKDYNHDGVLSSSGSGQNAPPLSAYLDNRVRFNLNPKYTGGLSNQFTYKGVSLSLLFDFVNQVGKNAYAASGAPGAMLSNLPVAVFNDHWKQPGDHAAFPAATTTANSTNAGPNFGMSDGVYTDASFFRLSNVAFSYNLPSRFIKRLKMQSVSLYVNAQSVFILTKYKGVDPELQSFDMMPQAKVYTGGISLSF